MHTDLFGATYESRNPRYTDPEHPLREDGIKEIVEDGKAVEKWMGRPFESHAQRALREAYESYKDTGGTYSSWAKAIGRGRNTVSKWVNDPLGASEMTSEDVEKTAQLFGVAVKHLQRNTTNDAANDGYLSGKTIQFNYERLTNGQKRLISNMILEMTKSNSKIAKLRSECEKLRKPDC